MVVVLSKVDGLDEELIAAQMATIQAVAAKHTTILAMSSTAHKGIKEVLRALVQKVGEVRTAQAAAALEQEVVVDEDRITLSDRQLQDKWRVRLEEGVYIVTGPKIEKFAARTDYGNVHSVNRLRDIMKKLGVTHELVRQGADGESVVAFGESAEYRMSLEEQ